MLLLADFHILKQLLSYFLLNNNNKEPKNNKNSCISLEMLDLGHFYLSQHLLTHLLESLDLLFELLNEMGPSSDKMKLTNWLCSTLCILFSDTVILWLCWRGWFW